MFDKFEGFVPYGQYGDLHTSMLTLWEQGDDKITVRQPGKYQDKTMGGDMVVCYTGMLGDTHIKQHRITYQDLLRAWVAKSPEARKSTLDAIHGGHAPTVFEAAIVALTVAEHRRYKQHAKCTTSDYGFPHRDKLWTGGRWLLLNFLVLLHKHPELLEPACGLVKLGGRALPMLEAMVPK